MRGETPGTSSRRTKITGGNDITKNPKSLAICEDGIRAPHAPHAQSTSARLNC